MWIDPLADVGRLGLTWLWLPTLVWTVLAGGAVLLVENRRQLHPVLRYRLGQAILFALPAILLVTPLAPVALLPGSLADPVPPPAIEARVSPDAASPAGLEVSPGPDRPGAAVATDGSLLPTRDAAASVPLVASILGLLTLAAAGVASRRFAGLLPQLAALWRIRRSGRELDDPEALERVAELGRRLGIRRSVTVLEGPEMSVPLTFGWLRPTIVLPAGLAGRHGDFGDVLLHELVHVRRWDFPWALTERLVRAAFAFHPLVERIGRSVDRDRETSCDCEVMATGVTDPRRYADLLCELADPTPDGLGVAAGFAAHDSHLKERLETMKNFLNDPVSPRLRLRSVLLACVVLAGTTALGACMGVPDIGSEDSGAEAVRVYDADGRPLNDGAYTAEIERLEAQVAYLEREIELLMDVAMARGDAGEEPWDSPRERTRFGLLNDMFEEQLRMLETYRMEEAARSATEG